MGQARCKVLQLFLAKILRKGKYIIAISTPCIQAYCVRVSVCVCVCVCVTYCLQVGHYSSL